MNLFSVSSLFFLACIVNTAEACGGGFTELGGICYYFSESESTWQEAVDSCKKKNSQLVSIDSTEKLLAIDSHILGEKRSVYFWTSGTDVGSEGTFRWSFSNKPLIADAPWCTGEPNNYEGREHCVQIQQKNYFACWNDERCERSENNGVPYYYICEKKP